MNTGTSAPRGFFRRTLDLYVDGFRNLSPTARKLWVIIIVKFIVMFAILKVFLFPDMLTLKYGPGDENHARGVREALIGK